MYDRRMQLRLASEKAALEEQMEEMGRLVRAPTYQNTCVESSPLH